MNMLDWGSVPLWLSAVAGLIAAVMSWRSLQVSSRQTRANENSLLDQEYREEGEQASKVAAWLELNFEGQDEFEFYICFLNMGSLPAFNVTAFPMAAPSCSIQVDTVPPSGQIQRVAIPELSSKIRSLISLAHINTEVNKEMIPIVENGIPLSSARRLALFTKDSGLSFSFLDNSRVPQLWRRDARGTLSKGSIYSSWKDQYRAEQDVALFELAPKIVKAHAEYINLTQKIGEGFSLGSVAYEAHITRSPKEALGCSQDRT